MNISFKKLISVTIIFLASQANAVNNTDVTPTNNMQNIAQPPTTNNTNNSYYKESPILEGYNHFMYRVNRTLDRYLIKPIAQGYHTIAPKPVRKSVGNFFNNLATVPTIANDLLQGKFLHAVSDTWRLGINTTIGIGGLFDIASEMGLKRHEEDFGLTLARWGYKDSAYFILPILGPRTIRDALGTGVDYFVFYPVAYIRDVKVRNSLLALNVIERRSELLDFDNVVEEAALDRYAFERDAYLQRRAYLIKHNDNDHHPIASNDTDDLYVAADDDDESSAQKNKKQT